MWAAFISNHLDEMRSHEHNPNRLCDIGAADGALTGYVSSSLRMNASAYDIVAPDHNIFSVGGQEMTHVEMFDGAHIPEGDAACALTMFAYVLHHAANNTYELLREAVRVTHHSGYVLITEDLAAPTDAERSARNLMHDPHGIFRTRDDWISLLQALELDVRESGELFGSGNPQYYFLTQPRASEARRAKR